MAEEDQIPGLCAPPAPQPTLTASIDPPLEQAAPLADEQRSTGPIESTTTEEAVAPIEQPTETFKVPALPTPSSSSSTTLQGLPADIEHILSLGANAKDLNDDQHKDTNYEQVVRDLKERAGLNGEVTMDEPGGDGLQAIEREMEASGVPREGGEVLEIEQEVKQEEQEQGDGMQTEEAELEVKKEIPSANMDVVGDDEASSSDSSSSGSSSDSDSDAPSPRATDGPSPSTTAATSTDGQKKKRVRKRPAQRARANSLDSDLSDDDVNAGALGAAPKTEHELDQPEVELPKLEKVPEGVELAQFGKVQSVIETVVVVKADTTGSYKVLDEGTVVCLEDRTVVGSIFETFGSVQQPFYSLRFPATNLPSPEIFTVDRPIYYALTLASFVFTRELRAMKGSDASNVWDEEVGAAEIEFSDDEQEQEYRRAQKAERRSRTASATPGPSRQSSRAPSTQPRPPPPGTLPSHLPARPSTLSYADLDAPDAPGPMSRTAAPPQRDLWSMGEKPPSGREGRRMFERDTGREVGDEVEFEFSDGEGEESEREVMMGASAGGRGGRGGRGRGEARGRGRGAERGRGRGGGGRGAAVVVVGGGRPVAGLPRGIAGLPQKPAFEAPPTEEERRSSLAGGAEEPSASASPAATRMISPSPQLRGSVPPPSSETPSHAAPPSSFAFGAPNAAPPQFFGASAPPPQAPYYPQQSQYPQQYSPAYPQQQQYPPAPLPQAQGHFNPRFFGAGGGGLPPPQQQQGGYPGYGATSQHGAYGAPPQQQQQQYWQGQPGGAYGQQGQQGQQPPAGPRGAYGGPPPQQGHGQGQGGW